MENHLRARRQGVERRRVNCWSVMRLWATSWCVVNRPPVSAENTVVDQEATGTGPSADYQPVSVRCAGRSCRTSRSRCSRCHPAMWWSGAGAMRLNGVVLRRNVDPQTRRRQDRLVEGRSLRRRSDRCDSTTSVYRATMRCSTMTLSDRQQADQRAPWRRQPPRAEQHRCLRCR